jgi:hypothetical protein
VPLGAVDDDHVRRLLRQQMHQQPAQRPEVDGVVGEKALDAPVVRGRFDAALQSEGELTQVGSRDGSRDGSREPEQRRGKPGYELEPGAMPRQMLGQKRPSGPFLFVLYSVSPL